MEMQRELGVPFRDLMILDPNLPTAGCLLPFSHRYLHDTMAPCICRLCIDTFFFYA